VIPVPRTASEAHLKALPPFLADEKNAGRIRWHWRFDTGEKYQEYMKNYYRLASEVDAACGRIVAELRAQGLLENTLVLFTGDNGYFHGEHGLADKWYPYEESIRVPLIVRDPRMAAERRGGTNDDFVLNADLAPTILAAARAAAPPRMQGTDFAPLYLADRKPAWRDEFYYEHAEAHQFFEALGRLYLEAAAKETENADRQFIYDTLMQQNNIPARDAPRVRAAFAKANRERAAAGEWVQQDNGQWTRK